MERGAYQPRIRLQLLPQLVSSAQQGHIVGPLVVGHPDDSAKPVGGPSVMRHPEALQAQALQDRGEAVRQRGQRRREAGEAYLI